MDVTKDTDLPNCSACGGVRKVTQWDMQKGVATVKELHRTDCTLVVQWQKTAGTKGTS